MIHIEKFVVGFLDTNCYVVYSDENDKAIIIDAGGGYAAVSHFLEEKNKKPIAVLCTHGHFDHIKHAKRWQDKGIPVYAHAMDKELLNGNKAEIEGHKFPIDYITADFFVQDGEKLVFADKVFEVIHTPGHTKGGVCYLLNDRYLFSGDTIFYHSYGRTDFYSGDYEEMKTSVKKILSREGDLLIYPGHGESTTLKEERLFNPLA